MRLPRILNQCHPIPGFVYGQASFAEDEQAVLLIPVRPRKRSAAICSGCHQPAPGYDQSPTPRRFEFIGFWGYLVFLVYCMRRVNCKQCGVLVEEVPWGMGKHASTKVHMHFLGHWARKLSWKETAEEFRTSWDKVHDAVEYLVTWGLEHRVLGAIRAIGVDEIQRGKGHKYLTLVYQIDLGCTRLLWIGKERTVKTFKEFFAMIGPEVSAKIEFVCSDMWKPYLGVIREKCSQALNILDRFHIVAKVNKALDDIRSAEARRMKGDGYEPVLTKSRWCLLKRPANLTANQKVKLKDLVRYNLQSVRAYLLKEDFQQLWNYNSTAWAAKFLDQWCRQVMRSQIEPMKKVARTLRAHRELILNYFRARKEFSSGVIEGLNNKAKVTMRKSYGFRTFRVTELALYHSLGKLRELSVSLRKEGWLTYFWEESPRIRRTEVRPTPRRRAISDLLTPARCSFRISAVCRAAVAGRPNLLPFSRAWARPARVRSRSISRSNSAKMASRPAIARPAGVVRSSASVSETKPTPRCSRS
jgi:transposase